jgi:hypothetical protein
MGYAIGRLVGFLLVPLLLMAVIGLVHYWRTRDSSQALRMALSWWAITLALVCLALGIVAQATQQAP